jgi:CNT family concentrative nucleoside transporter
MLHLAHQERSEIIVTYALCGFASLPTIGITFGLVTAFIPKRLPEITRLGFRLLVAGTVASYLTACVAGRNKIHYFVLYL